MGSTRDVPHNGSSNTTDNCACKSTCKASVCLETLRRPESIGRSTSKPDPHSSKAADGVAGMNPREKGERKKQKGVDRPMLAQWLRESDKAGPYTGVSDVGKIAEPRVTGQVILTGSTSSSLEYFDPVVEVGTSDVQEEEEEEAFSPVKTGTASISPHQDILAFCGSWQ